MQRTLCCEAASVRLGRFLALRAAPGDMIALTGDLGAGKTTLARGVICALTGEATDVPSPTFTLVQTYAAAGMTIYHADLYRLGAASELEELGLEEAVSGLALIEWPERIPHLLQRANLHVRLSFAETGRIAAIRMTDDWRARLHDLPKHF